MALFGKGQGRSSPAGISDISVERIIALKQQGYDNNQIIQTLQRDGYSSTQIFNALNQADNSQTQPANQQGAGTQYDDFSGQGFQQQPAVAQPEQRQAMQQQQPAQQSSGAYNTEELVEAIIDEKWNDLVADINKIVEWKNTTESKIASMQQQVEDIKHEFDKLHEAILSKVGEYDQHILEVGTEVKAMEKVFSKVLPVFTKNVQDLNEITKKISAGSSSRKSRD
ncbi:MAG: hypothetical protein V1659_04495 [Candidatus Woesearchaeota archaeon]